MGKEQNMEIKRSSRGPYWTLTVDGVFEGNFDTFGEALMEYEERFENQAASLKEALEA